MNDQCVRSIKSHSLYGDCLMLKAKNRTQQKIKMKLQFSFANTEPKSCFFRRIKPKLNFNAYFWNCRSLVLIHKPCRDESFIRLEQMDIIFLENEFAFTTRLELRTNNRIFELNSVGFWSWCIYKPYIVWKKKHFQHSAAQAKSRIKRPGTCTNKFRVFLSWTFFHCLCYSVEEKMLKEPVFAKKNFSSLPLHSFIVNVLKWWIFSPYLFLWKLVSRTHGAGSIIIWNQ